MEDKEIMNENPSLEGNSVVETTKEERPVDVSKTQKKKSHKGLIIVGIILLLVVALGGVGYFVLLTPERVVKHEINNSFKEAENAVKLYFKDSLKYDLEKESLGVSGDLTFNSTYNKNGLNLTKLKDYTISYDTVIDKPNNKASVMFNVKRLNKDFVNINNYVDGKNIISDLGDLYNRTIKFVSDSEIKDIELGNSANEKDIITLLERTREFAIDHVSKDKVTRDSGKFDVDGKKSLYSRIKYEIDSDKYEKDLYEFYKNDKESVEAIGNISGKSKEDVVKDLEDQIKFSSSYADVATSSSSKDSILNVNLYYKIVPIKYNFVEIADDEESFVFENAKDKLNVSVTEKGKKRLDGYYEKKSSKLYLNYNDSDTKQTMIFDLIINNEKVNGSIKITSDETDVNISVDSKTESRKNDDLTVNSTIGIDVKSGQESFDLSIKSNMEVKTKVKVNEVSEKNSVSIEMMSESDQQLLMQNIYSKIQSFATDIYPDLFNSSQFRSIF